MTALPSRAGPRPRTDLRAPHTQLDQLAPPGARRALSERLIAAIAALDGVTPSGSRRAPPGSIGFHLHRDCACDRERAFLLGTEFAHVHVADDASLHAILPEPLRSAAIAAGWAEPHPFAGRPTVSPDTVMLYAPRDDGEVTVVADLLRRSWRNAHARPDRAGAD